jgi:hypothetical protein
VARVGGDDFVPIGLGDVAEARLVNLAQGIIDALSRPMLIGDDQVSFSASGPRPMRS